RFLRIPGLAISCSVTRLSRASRGKGRTILLGPTKGKKLDNMRASGKDETIALVPPVRFTLEQALEFIQDDELCEVTPKSIRLRKKILDEGERTRAAKKAKN
ncbi:hypothetical protein ACQKP6_04995, partial [Pseudomonas fluorescens]